MIRLIEVGKDEFKIAISKDDVKYPIQLYENENGDLAICNGKDIYIALKKEGYDLKKIINGPLDSFNQKWSVDK